MIVKIKVVENYQEVETEVDIASYDDIETIIYEIRTSIKNATSDVEAKKAKKTGRAQVQQPKQVSTKPLATEKQKALLRKLGYVGDVDNLPIDKASEIITSLQA